MCGRFTLKTPPELWGQLLLPWIDFAPVVESWQPRFNIAPTQRIIAVVREVGVSKGKADMFRWGLVPSWAEDLSVGNRMVNARAETVAEKRSFKGPLCRRRCIVLADGYYEWQTVGRSKQPWWIHPTSGGVFGMAGLWEVNSRATGKAVPTCTIITTSANEKLSEIHDRMPVALNMMAIERWLDPEAKVEEVVQFLAPAASDSFDFQQVSTYVNNPRHESSECLNPPDQHCDQ
ncbi:MAG: SOS response-associated peptidase [Planctomycetales bacterium]|nr:SOS response-associated peptidase [Planctomycetales bacterium]